MQSGLILWEVRWWIKEIKFSFW